MGMLKSISLENYKCFEKLEDLEIKPLTILCGVNSSGKSSIIKSLLTLKQSYENGSDYNSLILNGQYTIDGTFNDVIRNHQGQNFYLKNTFEIYNSKKLSGKEKHTIEQLKEIFPSISSAKKIFINVEINIKKKKIKKLNITDNLVDIYKVTVLQMNYDFSDIEYQITLNHIKDNFYNIEIKNFPNYSNVSLLNCACYFEGLKLINLYFEKTEPLNINIDKLLNNIFSIFRIIPFQYHEIKYIAPLRNEPVRTYLMQQDRNSVGLHGEYTPQIIADNIGKKIYTILPPQNDILSTSVYQEDFETILNSWLNYLGIENVETILISKSDSIKMNIGKDNFIDVGFGVSQVLPILVTGILMKKYESLVLQQPEIHLHPNMQMNFADFLLSTAMKKKNIIIETHSDHIINRVARRIMEDKTGNLQNMVKIYFINKNNLDKPIENLTVDKVHGFVNAPDDFFSQFGSESSKIFDVGIKNMPKLTIG